MAAVGAEVAGSAFLSSGVVSFFILLLLLSIFLTALCSECSRRSFELRDSEDKYPSALVRVVALEDAMVARENPMINEIQNDEKEFHPAEANTDSFTPWRSHLGAPQTHRDIQTNGSAAVMKMASESETAGDLNSSTPPDSDHIYHTIGGGRSGAGVPSPLTNHEPGEEHGAHSDRDRNSVYARVSKKERPTTPPVHTPEEVQVEEEEEEESSPPLPDRRTQLEG